LAAPRLTQALKHPSDPPAEVFLQSMGDDAPARQLHRIDHYVERLESLPWTMQWESVRLDAHAHPRIELTLKLNTLSRESTWARL